MNVVGISGSPRRNGNTETLLDSALQGAAATGANTEKIIVCNYDISGCIECNDCFESGVCSIGDDMDPVYETLERADRIIFAAPMFFMGLPAQAKAVIDRCQCYWALKYILKQEFPRPKKGMPKRYATYIGVGGTRGEDLFEGTKLTLKYFFDAISAEPREDLYVLVRGVDDKGEINGRQEALLAAYNAGKALALLE